MRYFSNGIKEIISGVLARYGDGVGDGVAGLSYCANEMAKDREGRYQLRGSNWLK